MISHKVRGFMVITIGILMAASAFVVLFEPQHASTGFAQLAKNPQVETPANTISSIPATQQDLTASANGIPDISDGTVAVILVPPTFPLTFTGLNLPLGTIWGVVVNNYTQMTNGSSVSFQLPNGTYFYSVVAPSNYDPNPRMGYIGVYAQAQNVNINFTHVVYPVDVSVIGLPAGLQWGIDVAGQHYYSSENSMKVYCDNGTYNYSIFAPDYYTGTPSSGAILVYGTSVDINITFGLTTYAVTFSGIGLPMGTSWSVSFNGATYNSSGAEITILVTDGNYTYTVNGVDGYSVQSSSGYVLVNNASQSVDIQFDKNTNNLMTVGLLVGGVAIGAVGGFLALYYFRRKT